MTIAKSRPRISSGKAPPEKPDPTQLAPAKQNVIILPLELESNEPEVDSDQHREQIELLIACLKDYWRDRDDFYVTGNLTIYYNPNRLTTQDMRGPDFFVVLGAEKRLRKSWLLWAEEGKYPNIIIELLSDSTAKVDRTVKKELYQDRFRTPEYFWFHPDTQEFKGFRLHGGKYRPIKPNAQGWMWSQQLALFLGEHESQLRFFSPKGDLVPTAAEVAVQERQAKEQAQQQVEQERQARELAEQQTDQVQLELKALKAKLREIESQD